MAEADEAIGSDELNYNESEDRWQGLPLSTRKFIGLEVIKIIITIFGEKKVPIVAYYAMLDHMRKIRTKLRNDDPVPLHNFNDPFSLSNWVDMAHFYGKTKEIEALFSPYGFETVRVGHSKKTMSSFGGRLRCHTREQK